MRILVPHTHALLWERQLVVTARFLAAIMWSHRGQHLRTSGWAWNLPLCFHGLVSLRFVMATVALHNFLYVFQILAVLCQLSSPGPCVSPCESHVAGCRVCLACSKWVFWTLAAVFHATGDRCGGDCKLVADQPMLPWALPGKFCFADFLRCKLKALQTLGPIILKRLMFDSLESIELQVLCTTLVNPPAYVAACWTEVVMI